MSYRASRVRVRRVSSAAIRSASRRTRRARREMSSRLPMGVATTWRTPGRRPPSRGAGPGGAGAPARSGALRRLALIGDQDRVLAPEDHLARDDALRQPLNGGQLVHHVEHDVLQDRPEPTGPGAALERLAGDRHHRVVGELQADLLQLEVLLVLLEDRVLRLSQDADQGRLVQVVERRHHRQPADEFGDETELEQVLGLGHGQEVADLPLLPGLDVGAEAHPGLPDPALDDPVEADERAAADEQDVGSVDLDELLVRVLAAPLGGHVGHRALQDLEQRLLHALAGDVAGDRGVLRLPGDLVDLVDVDDAALGPLDVVVGGLEQPQDDVLHVLADVTGLGQAGGVGDGEGHVQDLGQGLSEERLARPGRADQEDVRLLQLDVTGIGAGLDALVVVVDGHRQDLLRPLLVDHVLILDGLDLRRLRQAPDLATALLLPLLRDDVVAELDALVADVDRWSRDQLANVVLALPAERALQNASVRLTRSGHSRPPFSGPLAARAQPFRPSPAAPTACAVFSNGTWDAMTWSTIPYSFACSAVMKKSRSVSRVMRSAGWPVCCTMMRFSSSRMRRISRAWMSMSVAWPCTPASGWWIMIRECGRANRLPLAPAHRSRAPMEAAWPMQMVATAGLMYCIVS